MRRAVLLVVGALAVGGYCLGAEPQQRVHRIGLLNPGTEVPAGFIQGLRKFGYVEGQNIFIEIRNAGGKAENLPGLLGDLSNRGVSVIVANGPTAVGVALKATKSIPIVMVSGGNPVRRGFVKSLSVPGGNVTGLSSAAPGVSAKRIELAKECLPWLARVVVLKPLSRRSGVSGYRRVAETLGIDYHVVDLSGDADLDRALALK
jgi:putative ABC transport system substrate-binding protein